MKMLLKHVSLVLLGASLATAFAPSKIVPSRTLPPLSVSGKDCEEGGLQISDAPSDRRSFVSTIGLVGGSILASRPDPAFADGSEEEESFASIAARASKLSTTVSDKQAEVMRMTADDKTAYDFSLPVKGVNVPFKDLINQEFDEDGKAKVKAILVVNMKEDDPISRTDIPEFISLAAKYVSDEKKILLTFHSKQRKNKISLFSHHLVDMVVLETLQL